MDKYCAVLTCKNSSRANRDLSFFPFPIEEERCKLWVKSLKRPDLENKSVEQLNKNRSVCADHFEPSQFMNDKRNRLVWNAVPTIFKAPNPPKKITITRPLPVRRSLLQEQNPQSSAEKACSSVTTKPAVSLATCKVVVNKLSLNSSEAVKKVTGGVTSNVTRSLLAQTNKADPKVFSSNQQSAKSVVTSCEKGSINGAQTNKVDPKVLPNTQQSAKLLVTSSEKGGVNGADLKVLATTQRNTKLVVVPSEKVNEATITQLQKSGVPFLLCAYRSDNKSPSPKENAPDAASKGILTPSNKQPISLKPVVWNRGGEELLKAFESQTKSDGTGGVIIPATCSTESLKSAPGKMLKTIEIPVKKMLDYTRMKKTSPAETEPNMSIQIKEVFSNYQESNPDATATLSKSNAAVNTGKPEERVRVVTQAKHPIQPRIQQILGIRSPNSLLLAPNLPPITTTAGICRAKCTCTCRCPTCRSAAAVHLKVKELRNKLRSSRVCVSRLNKKFEKISAAKKVVTYKQLDIGLKQFLNETAYEFVLAQIQIKSGKKRRQGVRWSPKIKDLILTMYRDSKRCYNMMRKIFNLPSKHSLISHETEMKELLHLENELSYCKTSLDENMVEVVDDGGNDENGNSIEVIDDDDFEVCTDQNDTSPPVKKLRLQETEKSESAVMDIVFETIDIQSISETHYIEEPENQTEDPVTTKDPKTTEVPSYVQDIKTTHHSTKESSSCTQPSFIIVQDDGELKEMYQDCGPELTIVEGSIVSEKNEDTRGQLCLSMPHASEAYAGQVVRTYTITRKDGKVGCASNAPTTSTGNVIKLQQMGSKS